MKFFSTYSHIFQTVFFFLLIGCSKEEVPEPTKAQDISEADALSREAKSGIQMLADGSKFSGEMEQGVPHGYGRKEFENGDAYEGQFNKGMGHGHGTFRMKSDSIIDRYTGMWASDKWDGFGTLVLKDGSRINGKWKKNRLEYGDYEGFNGVIKSGKWQGNWEFLSEGFSKNQYGAEFTGSFNSDGSYEKGFMQNPNGDLYTGSFYNNQYEGRGILEEADGDLYVGGFMNSRFSGVGILTENDGTKYSGEFKEGLPNGFGVQEDPNGIRYSGNWVNGLRDGAGTIDFGDGTSYVGEFRNGLAYEGQYDWGDGRVSNSFQDVDGSWQDR